MLNTTKIAKFKIKNINDISNININKLPDIIILDISCNNKNNYNIHNNITNVSSQVYINKGISEKINNEFYIQDDYILMNKKALLQIQNFIPFYIENKQKKFKYNCIKNIINSKNSDNPKYFMYILLILCGIKINIPNV